MKGIRTVVLLAGALLAPSLAVGGPYALPGPIGAHVHQVWLDPNSSLGYDGVETLLRQAGVNLLTVGSPLGFGPIVSGQRLSGWLDATTEWRQQVQLNTFELAPDEQNAVGIDESFRVHNQILEPHPNVFLVGGGNEPLSASKDWSSASEAMARVRMEYTLWTNISTVPFCHKFTNPSINEPGVGWAEMEQLWATHQDAICYNWYYPSGDSVHTLDYLRALGQKYGKPVYLLEAAIPGDDRAFLGRAAEGLGAVVLYHLAGVEGQPRTARLASWVVEPGGATDEQSQGAMHRAYDRHLATPAWTIATRFASPDYRAFNGDTLQWVDVDRNGRPEILATNANRRFYLFDPAGGTLASKDWPSTSAFPASGGLQPGIPVGDLDGDGRRELYVTGVEGTVQKWEHSPGESSATTLGLNLEWSRSWGGGGKFWGTPWGAAGKLFLQRDGDGGQLALKVNDGWKAWGSGAGSHEGRAGVATGDLTGDGTREVVFGTDQGHVLVRRADTGGLVWDKDVAAAVGVTPGSITTAPVLADLDGDGRKEILVAVYDAFSDDDRLNRARFVALDHDGSVQWSRVVARGNPAALARPVVLDLDGDGDKDVLWRDWNSNGPSLGHQRLGPGRVFALRGGDGSGLWSFGVHARWSDQALAVADADGDGKQELLVSEVYGSRDGIAVYSLQGVREAWWSMPSGWTIDRGIVAVNWQGRLHLLLSVAQPTVAEGVASPAGTSPTGQILLVDTGEPYRAAHSGQAIYAG